MAYILSILFPEGLAERRPSWIDRVSMTPFCAWASRDCQAKDNKAAAGSDACMLSISEGSGDDCPMPVLWCSCLLVLRESS